MRDLAGQNYSGGRNNTLRTVKIVVLAVAVSIAIWFLSNRSTNTTTGGGAIVLKEASKGLKPIDLPSDIASVGQAVNLRSDSAVFTNVSDLPAKATAIRKYGDGSYTLAVEATLPDPKGSKYEVWIIGEDLKQEAGFLNGSGNSWTLVFRDKDYYSKYNQIWITREITNNDSKPEKHILEGFF